MAVISAIRKRTGLVLGLVAVAVAGFIIMDMDSGNFGGQSMDTTLIEVEGQKVDWKEMLRTEEVLYAGSETDVFSRRDYLYTYFVEREVIRSEAEDIGITVPDAELEELQYGANRSPIIVQRFTDPATGQVNQEQINSIRQQLNDGSLDPQLRVFWQIQQSEIRKDRKQSKIATMINKALYAPAFMGEEDFRGNNDRYEVDYVKVPYSVIEDEDVEVTDRAINDHIKKNRKKYEQDEETRVLEYVIINVNPTASDSAAIRKELEDMTETFELTDNDTLFIENNMGSFTPAYDTREDFSDELRDVFFNEPVGSVYGPYEDGGFYKLSKIVDRKVIPDSVQSRHILIRVNTMEEAQRAQQRLDSIKTVLADGQATFAEMASQFSQDGSAQMGGDLGMVAPGTMVQEFNDFIFYNGEIGKPEIVLTQFGLHLVEVTDRKYILRNEGVQLATVQREIVPSEDTQRDVFDEAFEVANNNRTLESLRAAIDERSDLRLILAPPVKKNAFRLGVLPAGSDVRDIVRWAYGRNRKAGEVSGDVYSISEVGKYYTEKYVVVGLKNIISEGVPSAADKRDELEGEVRNILKAEKIKEAIAGKSMNEIESMYGEATRELAEEVGFNQGDLGTAGREPKVVGFAAGMEVDAVSRPIRGNGGVFVLQLKGKRPAETTEDAMFRSTVQSNARRQFDARFMESLKENFDVKDNRFKFY